MFCLCNIFEMSGKDAEGVLNYAWHEDSGTWACTRMVPCGGGPSSYPTW